MSHTSTVNLLDPDAKSEYRWEKKKEPVPMPATLLEAAEAAVEAWRTRPEWTLAPEMKALYDATINERVNQTIKETK